MRYDWPQHYTDLCDCPQDIGAESTWIWYIGQALFLFKSFFINVYDKIDAETGFLSVNTAILSWCTLFLLTGKGNPFVAAKTFSTAALLKAFLMFFNPIKASQKFFGINVGTDGMCYS